MPSQEHWKILLFLTSVEYVLRFCWAMQTNPFGNGQALALFPLKETPTTADFPDFHPQSSLILSSVKSNQNYWRQKLCFSCGFHVYKTDISVTCKVVSDWNSISCCSPLNTVLWAPTEGRHEVPGGEMNTLDSTGNGCLLFPEVLISERRACANCGHPSARHMCKGAGMCCSWQAGCMRQIKRGKLIKQARPNWPC